MQPKEGTQTLFSQEKLSQGGKGRLHVSTQRLKEKRAEAGTGDPTRGLLQEGPDVPTFKLQTFKDANVRSQVQSHKQVHVSGAYCHTHVSSVRHCAFVYFTVVYRMQ